MGFIVGLTIGLLLMVCVYLYKSCKQWEKSRWRSYLSAQMNGLANCNAASTSPAPSAHGAGCKCSACSNPEANAQAEQIEYFTGCLPTRAAKPEDDDYVSAGEFGKGLSYNDYAAAQAVDQQVIKNHAEFVKERAQGGSVNWTGRTYSPDSNESYDPQPWIGIRGRPQRVQVCSPTQVPDMDLNLFPNQQKLVWRT